MNDFACDACVFKLPFTSILPAIQIYLIPKTIVVTHTHIPA